MAKIIITKTQAIKILHKFGVTEIGEMNVEDMNIPQLKEVFKTKNSPI